MKSCTPVIISTHLVIEMEGLLFFIGGTGILNANSFLVVVGKEISWQLKFNFVVGAALGWPLPGDKTLDCVNRTLFR